jgi:hypothetical protein
MFLNGQHLVGMAGTQQYLAERAEELSTNVDGLQS